MEHQRGAVALTKAFARTRAHSFVFAFRGVVKILRTQQNAWVHVVASITVVVAGLLLDVSRIEWALLVAAMMAVWSSEALNTAIEALGDAVSLDHHPQIGLAKDVAAAAVLIAAVGAVVIGALVFVPRLLRMAELMP
jgi:diacylglycerol kinase (ATP)